MGFTNGHLLRVTLSAQLGSRTEVNTFHYDLVNAPLSPDNDVQTLADTFRDDVLPTWADFYRPRWTINPVEIVDEFDPLNPTAPRSSWTSGSSGVGTRGGSTDLLPSAVCWVMSLQTAHIGRRFRGRNFIGGDIDEGAQSDGSWVSGAMTEWQAFADLIPVEPDLATGPSDSTANWCVYSRTQRAANLNPYASAITGKTVRPQVFWRRKRAGI